MLSCKYLVYVLLSQSKTISFFSSSKYAPIVKKKCIVLLSRSHNYSEGGSKDIFDVTLKKRRLNTSNKVHFIVISKAVVARPTLHQMYSCPGSYFFNICFLH